MKQYQGNSKLVYGRANVSKNLRVINSFENVARDANLRCRENDCPSPSLSFPKDKLYALTVL